MAHRRAGRGCHHSDEQRAAKSSVIIIKSKVYKGTIRTDKVYLWIQFIFSDCILTMDTLLLLRLYPYCGYKFSVLILSLPWIQFICSDCIHIMDTSYLYWLYPYHRYNFSVLIISYHGYNFSGQTLVL